MNFVMSPYSTREISKSIASRSYLLSTSEARKDALLDASP